jgi:iron complex outermembrane receptor protein
MRILYTLLFISTCCFSQHKLSGKITDETTKLPLSDVSIYLKSENKGTSTSTDGSFNVTNIPSGTYDIFISYLGYQEVHKEVFIESDVTIDFQLHPTALELEGILISAPFHKLQKDNVMTVEKIKTASLTNANNLAEQLSDVPGINQIGTGNGIGKPVIRGLSSNRVLVYTQGVRLENQQFGEEHGLGISSAGIESVEIIKGPASLLYGSDAIGGVLFLNPELYAPKDSLDIDIATKYFSNTNGLSTNFGIKNSTENVKLLARFSMQQHADYQFDDTHVTNSRFSEYDLKTGIGFNIGKTTNDLRYNVNFSRLGIPEEIGIQNDNIKPLLPNQAIENHVLSLHSVTKLNKGKLDMTLGYTFNNRKEFEEEHHHGEHEDEHEEDHEEEDEHHDEEEELAPALEMHLNTLNYNFKYEFEKRNDFEVIVGTQGMFQSNKNFGEEILIPDATTTDAGLFGTAHYHWNKHAVQFGVRYDYRNINITNLNLQKKYNSFNGAIGFKTDFTSKLTGRINIASGFRAPNLAELTSDGEHEGSNRYEIGDINLKNEQNIQLDLNLNYKSEHFEVFANGFYNSINNYIFINPTNAVIDDAQVFRYLQDDATLYGGEVGIHLHPHPLDWLHLNSSFETVTGQLSDNTYLPLIPANSINTKVAFTINKVTNKKNATEAFISLKNVFKQNNTSYSETKSKHYDLVNIGASTQFTISKQAINLNIGVNNLFDKNYINHLSRLKTDGIYNQGRNIVFGLSLNL